MAGRRRGQERGRADHRGQREGPDQVCHGQLGLRRRAGPDDGHVVVARLEQDRLLPLRREQGPRLHPADGPGQALHQGRHRSLPQGRPAQPRGRAVRLRRQRQDHDQDRRPRRQALRGRRRRPLRLPGPVGSGRRRASLHPDQPPPEHPRALRRRPGHGQGPRHPARGMAHGLGREQPRHDLAQGQQALPMGFGALGLPQLLPLRHRRQAAGDRDQPSLRGGRHRQGRRGRRAALVHGPRRRQSHDDAAAPDGPGRQERRPSDRSRLQPLRQPVAGRQVVRRYGPDPRRRPGPPADGRQGQAGGRSGQDRHLQDRRAGHSGRPSCSSSRPPTGRPTSTASCSSPPTSTPPRSTR